MTNQEPPARKRRFSGLPDDALQEIIMHLVQAASEQADGTSAAAPQVSALAMASKRLRAVADPMLNGLKAAQFNVDPAVWLERLCLCVP